MKQIAILGSGMAGLGAAYRLRAEGVTALIYDKNGYYGGHTASFKDKHGFTFDEGPHISFTKDERMRSLLIESADNQVHIAKAESNNYWKGFWIKHPAQCNLYGLPVDLVTEIIHDFVEATRKPQGDINTYQDWLTASFGNTFAHTFPMQYGHKYHTVTADRMSVDWLGPRIYRPTLEEVLRGALTPSTPNVHYISEFRYPTQGGFVTFLNRFSRESEFRLNRCLLNLDPAKRELRFDTEEVVHYDHVISSIPLPDLVSLVHGVPFEVKEAVSRLACTSCLLVNVGINREDISPAHWTYFYDDEFCFTRVSFPHMFSHNNAPPGCGSIQAELYFSEKYRPIEHDQEHYITASISGLRQCGFLHEDDKIITAHAKLIRYANIIYDLDRAKALETVHGYLDEIGVEYCGRYGEWGYQWTDEAFVSGERAAQRVLNQMSS